MKKCVVCWQDRINLCVVEVSSSLQNAKIVKTVIDEVNIEKAQIYEYDDFVEYLQEIINFHKNKEENMEKQYYYHLDVFHPTMKEFENAEIDKYYKKIMASITFKRGNKYYLPSI